VHLEDTTQMASGGPQPLPAVKVELTRGTLIGRYVVLSKLGAGGMGVVYAAYDPELDRKVAVKLLHTALGHQDVAGEARTRLMREAQALAKLSDPNVVAVHDVGTINDSVWLAMDFVEGQTFAAWCRQGPRDRREILDILERAGRGLAAAHRAGLVHRDFKPDNVMVGIDGQVRVMDLGLARKAHEDDKPNPGHLDMHGGDTDVRPEIAALAMRVTQAGAVVGTPFYMAPEQLKGAVVGPTADIFAFCVTAWEALYTERPFTGETLIELMSNVLTGKIRPPTRGRSVPVWIRKVLERGLQCESHTRWPTMEALLDALARDPRRTRRRALLLGAAAVAVAAAGYGAAAVRTASTGFCHGAGEELAAVWNAERRTTLEQAIQTTGVAYAERSLITAKTRLDAYADAWIAASDDLCEKHQRGHLSSQLFDRRMACLRQRRSELDATIDVLAQTSRATVGKVVDVVVGLPGVELCIDDALLLTNVAPPEDPVTARDVDESRGRIARLHALKHNGQYSLALTEATPILADADRIGYLPLQADVQLLIGELHMQSYQMKQANSALDEAIRLGIAASADLTTTEALTIKLYVTAALNEFDEAKELIPITRAFLERVRSPPRLDALFHNNLGLVHQMAGDDAQALEELERASAIYRSNNLDDPLRWGSAANTANSMVRLGRIEQAEVLLRDTLAQFSEQNDPCHPAAVIMRAALAGPESMLGQQDSAIAHTEQSLQCLGLENPNISIQMLSFLIEVYLVTGDLPQAKEQLARADTLIGRTTAQALHPESILYLDTIRADVLIYDHQLAEARKLLTRVTDEVPAESRNSFVLLLETRFGLIAYFERNFEIALTHLLRVPKISTSGFGYSDEALYSFTLARTLYALGRPPEQARVHAERALEIYAAHGALYVGRAAEVREWLRETLH